MPTVDIYNWNHERVGQVELSDDVFAVPSKPHLYHTVIRAQLLSRRRGTAKTKRRGEVRGSTRKVYRQKGTGRARHGDRRAPIFRHGGVAFGPVPKDWTVRLPRKVRKAALRSALSDRLREGRLIVLDRMELERPKTRTMVEFMKRFGIDSALIVDQRNEALSLSCRNLAGAKYLCCEGLNLFDVLKYGTMVVSRDALSSIEGVLKP